MWYGRWYLKSRKTVHLNILHDQTLLLYVYYLFSIQSCNAVHNTADMLHLYVVKIACV